VKVASRFGSGSTAARSQPSRGYALTDRHAGEPIITSRPTGAARQGHRHRRARRNRDRDDIWTGHFVYITIRTNGYEDIDLPIGVQCGERPGVDRRRRWLGQARSSAGVPSGSVASRDRRRARLSPGLHVPAHCVVAGVPARNRAQARRGEGWVTVPANDSRTSDNRLGRQRGGVRPSGRQRFGFRWSNAGRRSVVERDRVRLSNNGIGVVGHWFGDSGTPRPSGGTCRCRRTFPE